jgi:hypothetical protein
VQDTNWYLFLAFQRILHDPLLFLDFFNSISSSSVANQYLQHILALVAPACSALAVAAGADTLWRSLIYALLV